MKPFRAITFDCAHTLMDASGNPLIIAIEILKEMGHDLPEHAAGLYGRAFSRLEGVYAEANLTGDPDQVREFWLAVISDWFRSMHLTDLNPAELHARVDDRLWTPPSTPFSLYADTLPAIRALHEKEVPMAVISNWDLSLHRALEMHGLTPYFQFALASMEVGIEKPDPAIFDLASDRLGISPEHILHVGDHPTSDFAGARQAGFQSILLDRTLANGRSQHRIALLTELGPVADQYFFSHADA